MSGSGNPQNVQTPQPQPFTAAMTPASGGNIFQQSAQGLTGAMGGAQAAMGYQPQQVGTSFGYNPQGVSSTNVGTNFGYNPQNVSAQQAAGGIGTYMNPYTQQVIDTTMADLDRQRQMQQNQLGAQASAARAFGGSRQGIAEAETNRAFAQQGGQLAAQLRQQGFNTALGASQQDVANQMQAALANQAAGGRATEFGQQLGFQGQTANQQAAMQAALANQAAAGRAAEFGQSTGLQAALANQQAGLSGANLRMAGAGQLGNLAQQGFNMGQSIQQQQFQQGQMQQALNQALIDAAKGQYGGFTGAPAASLQLPLAALGAGNMGQNTTTQTQKRGLFDYLTAGLTGLGGLM